MGTVSLRVLAIVGTVAPAWLTPARRWTSWWLLLWGAFMVVLWVRSLARYVVVRRYRQPRECLRIDDPFRVKTRRAFALVLLLVITRAPFLIALLLSRPWLDHKAYTVWAVLPANVEPQQSPGLQGLVMVRRISAGPNEVTFHLLGGGQVVYRPTADRMRLECEWYPIGRREH
jgi:hypothetical protein